MISRVNFAWYLVPILPILAVGYAALMNWLPSWFLLVALFAFFMWLFSLVFTLATLLLRKPKEPRQ